ncbi:MAG: hypothetical protein SFX74_02085 [Fimbriimonadaceae bacterium]|nr:hypothetical protein [Fimbriimonadaceae bacterium]
MSFSKTGDNVTGTIQWEIRPAPPSRLQTCVVGVIAFGSFALGVLIGVPLLAIGAPIFIAVMVAPAYLPRRYRLTTEFAEGGTHQMRWEAISRAQIDGNVVLLSPFAQASRRDGTRGVRLVMPPEHREAILAYIGEHLHDDARFLEGGADRRGVRARDHEDRGLDPEARAGSTGDHGPGNA